MQSPASSDKALPRVTVQILHWRGLDKTRQCLTSVMAINYPNLAVLLVDNGSQDGDHSLLQSEFPGIGVLALDQNYGFAGGSNRGLQKAMAEGADFIWLLNNDATVRPETLLNLVQIAMANAGAGALGATVIEGLGASEDAIAGIGTISWARAKTFLQKIPRIAATAKEVQTFHRCEWLSGSNLLLRAAALQKTGLFDERYFLYFEDVDLCLRINKADYVCLLVTGSPVLHEGNASTQGGLSLWRAYYHTRNRLIFFMQNSPPQSKLMAMAAILTHFLRHCLSLPLKGKAGRAKLYAEWLGVKDYYSGKIGKATCLDWCDKIDL